MHNVCVDLQVAWPINLHACVILKQYVMYCMMQKGFTTHGNGTVHIQWKGLRSEALSCLWTLG